MASEKPLAAVTCTAPVNIAVIKYWSPGACPLAITELSKSSIIDSHESGQAR
ncbi:mevalonate diphosphate decarboxylase [Homo sapiens]|uniref:Mevalonate diphosphate decarboxylase n=1 Tax=Homo sapiens TaxID=9606 RepID=H3BVC4_HUMAN|nr:mevalonate diphosphate decarboxylase [Homo sapiens]KAI4056468.1 mevalonate diphosphate decarboxylase [Homo sapiens]